MLAMAAASASCAVALAANGNGQYGANNVGKHGKQPARHTPVPSITQGPLSVPSPIAPVTNRSFTASPKRGRILARPGGPHGPSFITLKRDTSLPLGAVIDASHGTAALTVTRDRAGKRQVVELTGGQFIVGQHGRRPITDIVLTGGDFARCPRMMRRVVGSAAAARRLRRRSRHGVVRQLWARDDHGRFTTYGLTSVATVRGTVWLTQDRCDGTLTRVLRGRVLVRDRVLHRTVVLTAGREYLASRGRMPVPIVVPSSRAQSSAPARC
jgi:hypothetical protein